LFDNVGNGGRSCFVVDRHPDQFRSGASERGDLLDRGGDVGSVGVGHRLHHNWCIRADLDVPDGRSNGFAALDEGHVERIV